MAERLKLHGEMLTSLELRNVPKSSFDRSKHNFSSGKLGKIIPTRLSEVYPGDSIKGHIQSVVQFEPLAAPIMGSMVMKQESFFVPYHQLWKNAYNFFTGKNGYNEKVPSISPRQLFHDYQQELSAASSEEGMNLWNFVSFSEIVINEESFVYTEFMSALNHSLSLVQAFAEENKLVDVFQWYIDLLTEYKDVNNKYNKAIKEWQLDTSNPGKRLAMGAAFANFYYRIYDGFFGLSTAFDYLGWPTMSDMRDFFLSDAYNADGTKVKSVYWLFATGNGFGDEFTDPDLLFSSIPLTFMPFRAHYAIWYWNYRDELLETGLLDPEGDEFLSDTISSRQAVVCTLLRPRCWYKDTFTTALNNTGSGNLVVPTESFIDNSVSFEFYNPDGLRIQNVTNYIDAYAAGASTCGITLPSGLSYRIPLNYLNTSSTVNSEYIGNPTANYFSLDLFDRIKRLQNFVQKRLVLGYEADDVIWSSFMVRLSNVRMRIPEILSRGRDEISINTLVNNTSTELQQAGDKSAIAYGSGRTSDIDYFAEEWGLFLSYFSILPIQSYSGGLKRLWLKQEQFDFMWPEFATMGMDAIYNYELSAPRGFFSQQGLQDETALAVFGYQGRYYDLKSTLDEEHGRLRSDLNYLTFSREFNEDNKPKLNYIFIHCWPALDMFVTDDPLEDLFRMDTYFDTGWNRRLPMASQYL